MTEQHAAAVRLAVMLGTSTVQAQRLIARGRRQSSGTWSHQTERSTR